MEQQAKLATQHAKLVQPYSFINSDLFKATALAQQSSLNAITARLTKNVERSPLEGHHRRLPGGHGGVLLGDRGP
jgi:hypothetical protein